LKGNATLTHGDREVMNEQTQPSKTVSVVLPREQRDWLLHQAADRAAKTGERASASAVVRDLIQKAAGASEAA
jgi:Arc/MetJ-type ribon-helix-helix transcriptional regulator